MDDLIDDLMEGDPSAEQHDPSHPAQQQGRRTKVERDWREEEESPDQDPDDSQDDAEDGQDGDPSDQQGNDSQQGDSDEGDSQQNDSDQGDSDQGNSEQQDGGDEGEAEDGESRAEGDEGESECGEGEGESDSSEGEASEGEGDPSEGESSGGDPSDGSGQSQGEQSQSDTQGESDGQPSGGSSSGGGSGQGGAQPQGQNISDEQAEQIRKNRDLSSSSETSGEETSGEDSSAKSEGQKRREEKAQELNDQAFGTGGEEKEKSNWDEAREKAHSGERVTTGINEESGQDYYTDKRYVSRAQQIEEKIQDFAYEINENEVESAWTPQQIEDHKLATMFALLVAKVAEDMSYEKTDGDRFWDTHEIMKRQVTKRPLHQCRHDYEKSRLALLVDTSPSCADEAIFYSKIASGAMLRDDIDIFLCPNGRIKAKFDRKAMRFVKDSRRSDWDLDGRVVLYFTDWDGRDQIIENSKDSKIYWMDNTTDMWDEDEDYSRKTRYKFRGEHFEIPDPETFKKVARKIRP